MQFGNQKYNQYLSGLFNMWNTIYQFPHFFLKAYHIYLDLYTCKPKQTLTIQAFQNFTYLHQIPLIGNGLLRNASAIFVQTLLDERHTWSVNEYVSSLGRIYFLPKFHGKGKSLLIYFSFPKIIDTHI